MIPLINGISENWFAYMASAAFQATLLALLILVVLGVRRRWRPALRHAILMLALCKFLFPPMLSLPTGVFDRIRPQEWSGSAPALRYIAPVVQNAIRPLQGIEFSSGSTSSVTNSWIADVESGTIRSLPAQKPALTTKAKLLLLHFSGALLILAAAALQQFYLRRLALRATPAKDLGIEGIYDAFCRSMNLRRRPRLLISGDNRAPVTFGAWRPVVILPQAIVAALPPEEIRIILGHELAHHRRRDPWLLWLQVIVSAIWWFNPVYWLLARTVRSVREDCCDDMVVAAGIASRESYCRTLLRAARVTCNNPVAGAALAYLGESQPLRRRFNRIMTAKSIVFPKLAGWGILTVSALALLLLPGIRPRALAQNAVRSEAYTRNIYSAPRGPASILRTAGTDSKTGSRIPEVHQDRLSEEALNRLNKSLFTAVPQAQSSQEFAISNYYYYRKWLDEDVVYIITPEERNGFLALKTDEERDSYIEQFWARRNPSFKEEHYRRIAYANEHFASGSAAWKTDRGRIYITWGKPDEIESHPLGGFYNRPTDEGGGITETFPFERWLYRHIDGVGDDIQIEFVDRSRTGEYRMAKGFNEKNLIETDSPGLVYYSLLMDCSTQSGDKTLCRITARFDNKDLEFIRQKDFYRATVNIYGKISDLAGRVLAEWEDAINVEYPDRLLETGKTRQSEYQKTVNLTHAGEKLKFAFALKDINSNRVFEQRWENKPANLESTPVNVFERMKVFFEKTDER